MMGQRIDRWIDRLQGKLPVEQSRPQAVEQACAQILLTLGEGAAGYRLVLTGTAPPQAVAALFAQCKEPLAGAGIRPERCENPARHAAAFQQLGAVDGVVLVEQQRASTWYEVELLLELLQRAGVPVLGCIWLQG